MPIKCLGNETFFFFKKILLVFEGDGKDNLWLTLFFETRFLMNDKIIFSKIFISYTSKYSVKLIITKNAPLSWQLTVPGLEKCGLIGRYSHPLAVHVIGGISRR
jgi:hypothetical protein